MLIGARLAQGTGAAMMIPAALSILTTSFSEGSDRNKAIGAWGATAGLASALGVFLGGVLSEGPGWRWVFFVNLPVCVLDLVLVFRLVAGDRRRSRLANFDLPGALLATSGMLLLIYAIIKAPDVGWGTTRTIGEFAGAAILLLAFALNEARQRNPLFPFSILRIRGLAAADLTQVIAMAGFYAMFFFLTLYMQNVLGFSRIQAGAAYLPTTLGVAISSGIAAKLFERTGTRPIIITGALLGAAGVFWLSHIPVQGSYVRDLLPGLLIMSVGLGAVFVGVTTAAQAGVPSDKAGLAAALINTSTWLGGALGIAIFSAISTSRAHRVLATHASVHDALTAGFQRALLACSIAMLAAAVLALRATNTRGEPVSTPALDVVPMPENA
jgi:EmrB/QacA subfamily drug resistance transporter